MEEKKNKFLTYLRSKMMSLGEWMKPDRSDHPLLQVVKLMFKCVAVLLLIAFSPVIIVIVLLGFFAAF